MTHSIGGFMSNTIQRLIARRTQLLDELWDLDKELTRLEAIDRERERAALGVDCTSRRRCGGCRRNRSCRQAGGRWLCARCRGIERSKRISSRPICVPAMGDETQDH